MAFVEIINDDMSDILAFSILYESDFFDIMINITAYKKDMLILINTNR